MNKTLNYNLFLEKTKQAFEYLGLSQNEYEKFLQSLDLPSFTSIKLNNKIITERRLNFEEIIKSLKHMKPLFTDSKDFFYSDEKQNYSDNDNFVNGYFYPQEASSIYYGEIIDQILNKFLKKEKRNVLLDLCAAPGGKTLSINDILEKKYPESLLISNEIEGVRNKTLVENVTKWECRSTICCQTGSYKLGQITNLSDFIFVDVPCSGEGIYRKNIDSFLSNYSENIIKQCKNRQIEIIQNVSPCLNVGGYLLYSTCTYNLQENEEMVKYACDNLGFEVVDLRQVIKPSVDYLLTKDGFVRFFPHIFKGEGLFIALLKKKTHYNLNNVTLNSPWKEKRIRQAQITNENRTIINHRVKKDLQINLVGKTLLKHDIVTSKPTDVFLTSDKLVETIARLNSQDVKLTFIGKRVASYGKNIEQSLKTFT